MMYELIKRLYPICCSITGEGTRETLNIIKEYIPIEIHEVPTGTKVFDWSIPKEWNITDAYVKNSKGERIVDFKKSNVHILNYSVPIKKKLPLAELKKHLFTLPEAPDQVPYLTSYYEENWGFCITHRQYEELKEDEYEVCVDSSLKDGHLTYGELLIEGALEDEVLFTTYICHPSLCNDNLSGIALQTLLASALKDKQLNYSYRFLFIPETIGAITWLSLNENKVPKIKHGLVATCVGDAGKSTYKKTKRGNAIIDKVVEKVLKDSGAEYNIVDFCPFGSDERQFSSLAFNLDVGSLTRTPCNSFAEYHTLADNLDFVAEEYLQDSLDKYLDAVFILEHDGKYLNLNPKCEPNLGKRGLCGLIGGRKGPDHLKEAIFWVLSDSDGNKSLLDTSISSGMPFKIIKQAADLLCETNLLKRVV